MSIQISPSPLTTTSTLPIDRLLQSNEAAQQPKRQKTLCQVYDHQTSMNIFEAGSCSSQRTTVIEGVRTSASSPFEHSPKVSCTSEPTSLARADPADFFQQQQADLPEENLSASAADDPSLLALHQQLRKRLIRKRSVKNTLQNIGRAVSAFILSNRVLLRRVLQMHPSICEEEFVADLKRRHSQPINISRLREMWLESSNPYAEPLRKLWMLFVRKHSMSHIFNSRISVYGEHLRCRSSIILGLARPEKFTSLKEF